jgi:hypothetical protein
MYITRKCKEISFSVSSHAFIKPFSTMQCPHCYRRFNKKLLFEIHQEAHATLQQENAGIHCHLCGLHFLDSHQYESHVQDLLHLERGRERKRQKQEMVCVFLFLLTTKGDYTLRIGISASKLTSGGTSFVSAFSQL